MFLNVDMIYPVGAIYISASSKDPSTLFGGTWKAINGRFLLSGGQPSQNTNGNHGSIRNDELGWSFQYGQTLGEYRHQLSVAELASHSHMPVNNSNYFTCQSWNGGKNPAEGGAGSWTGFYSQFTGSTGGDSPHNNIPPAYVVYM